MARLAIPPLALLTLALLTMSSVAEDTKEDTKLTPKALQEPTGESHSECVFCVCAFDIKYWKTRMKYWKTDHTKTPRT